MRTSEMEMIAESDDGNLVHTVLLIMRFLCDLRGFFSFFLRRSNTV
jgi:hypothetical protein